MGEQVEVYLISKELYKRKDKLARVIEAILINKKCPCHLLTELDIGEFDIEAQIGSLYELEVRALFDNRRDNIVVLTSYEESYFHSNLLLREILDYLDFRVVD